MICPSNSACEKDFLVAPTEHHVVRHSVMAAVYNGRSGVGELSERWRQTVAMSHGPHKTNESIGLPGMVGEQADSVEHLTKAGFHFRGIPVLQAACLDRLLAV